MSEVDIEVHESPQVDSAPVVVVAPESSADSVPSWAVDLIERMTRLEQSVVLNAAVTAEVAEAVEDVAIAADVALDAADTAITVAIQASDTAEEVAEIAIATAVETDVLPEVIEDTGTELVPDAVPQKTHPLFRSLEDWRGTIGG